MNSGAAPVVNAPKSGPPVAVIVIVILVIIGIIVGVVMSTPVAPSPAAVTSPSPMAPSPAAPFRPAPMPVPVLVASPSPAAPFRPAPMPVPVLVAPPPTGYQFDESCVKPALQTVFQGDAPFIPDYINFLKSSKVQTAPLGSPCPSGTTSEKTPPDMKCQACVPNELINKQPPMPDTLQKQIMDWNQKQSGAMDSKKQEVQGMPAPRPNEVGGTAGSKEVGGNISITEKQAPMPEAKFFTDCDFKGDVLSLRGAKIPDLGVFNKGQYLRKISSIQVPKGLAVVAFSGPNFTGSKLIIKENTFACLLKVNDGVTTWNDRISSFYIEEVK